MRKVDFGIVEQTQALLELDERIQEYQKLAIDAIRYLELARDAVENSGEAYGSALGAFESLRGVGLESEATERKFMELRTKFDAELQDARENLNLFLGGGS